MQKIMVFYAHLLSGDLNYGLSVDCYVCSRTHSALYLARIKHKRDKLDVPLCEACYATDPKDGGVIRKFLNAPDLKLKDMGEWDPAWERKQ
jgi:hypothetical protein